jgi:molybdopterin molybdotransferase
MLSVTEARARVLGAVRTLDTIRLPIAEATGAVLADDLHAPHSLPAFDNSAMDGYAVIASDTDGATPAQPHRLKIIGEIRAGVPGEVVVEPGSAARIMTGAPVPDGADAIVPVEQTKTDDQYVEIEAGVEPGRHVRPAGDDLKQGDLLVRSGTELGAGELALLASMGFSPVTVHRPPRVAIVVTGDELVAPEDEPGPGQIRDSNSVALGSLVREAGGVPLTYRAVADDLEATCQAFEDASVQADLVVSSGGVAVGKYDFVKPALERLGRLDMWKVAMQPGKPVVLGAIGEVPFLGLPGNPVSIHVSFEQFVRPALRKMRGCSRLLRPIVKARLTDPLEKSPGRLHFVRVRLEYLDGEMFASPTGGQGSHIQSSLIGCDGLARFHADETLLQMGDIVDVEVWRFPEAIDDPS